MVGAVDHPRRDAALAAVQVEVADRLVPQPRLGVGVADDGQRRADLVVRAVQPDAGAVDDLGLERVRQQRQPHHHRVELDREVGVGVDRQGAGGRLHGVVGVVRERHHAVDVVRREAGLVADHHVAHQLHQRVEEVQPVVDPVLPEVRRGVLPEEVRRRVEERLHGQRLVGEVADVVDDLVPEVALVVVPVGRQVAPLVDADVEVLRPPQRLPAGVAVRVDDLGVAPRLGAGERPREHVERLPRAHRERPEAVRIDQERVHHLGRVDRVQVLRPEDPPLVQRHHRIEVAVPDPVHVAVGREPEPVAAEVVHDVVALVPLREVERDLVQVGPLVEVQARDARSGVLVRAELVRDHRIAFFVGQVGVRGLVVLRDLVPVVEQPLGDVDARLEIEDEVPELGVVEPDQVAVVVVVERHRVAVRVGDVVVVQDPAEVPRPVVVEHLHHAPVAVLDRGRVVVLHPEVVAVEAAQVVHHRAVLVLADAAGDLVGGLGVEVARLQGPVRRPERPVLGVVVDRVVRPLEVVPQAERVAHLVRHRAAVQPLDLVPLNLLGVPPRVVRRVPLDGRVHEFAEVGAPRA